MHHLALLVWFLGTKQKWNQTVQHQWNVLFFWGSLKSLCMDKKSLNENSFYLFTLIPAVYQHTLLTTLPCSPLSFWWLEWLKLGEIARRCLCFLSMAIVTIPVLDLIEAEVSLCWRNYSKSSLRNDLVALVGDEAKAVFLDLVKPFFSEVIVGIIYSGKFHYRLIHWLFF